MNTYKGKKGTGYMEQVIIYGAGNTGRSAYFYLKTQYQYECLFFVDSNHDKWGTMVDGLPVKEPKVLGHVGKVKVIIASVFWKEILDEIKEYDNLVIMVYSPLLREKGRLKSNIVEELNHKTIDLGAFLENNKEILCKELTFTTGGSTFLDYAFLKALCEKYHCKNYLEIGSFIGESINILTDCCEKLYSVTEEVGESDPVFKWYKRRNLPYYGGRLMNNEKIIPFYTDSKKFDFSQVKEEIDLFFIDGDHSYEGVYADTQNIFNVRKDDAIVVWHDFRGDEFQLREEVVNAVKDALGDKFKNVYVTNSNLCGIYLPDIYIKDFVMRELKYEENAVLYTYDVLLKNCQVR